MTAEVNLASTQATIAASETPSAATIAQDEAAVKQAQATVTADAEGARRDDPPRPDLRHRHRGQRLGRRDGQRERLVGEPRRGERVELYSRTGTGAAATGGRAPVAAPRRAPRPSSRSTRCDKLEVVSGFAEADATKLAVGQPATITFPALTNTEVAGKVIARLEHLDRRQQRRHLRRHDRARQPAGGRQGGHDDERQRRHRDARATCSSCRAAAITTNGDDLDRPARSQNGKTTVTRVTTGLVGDSTTEIVSGLQPGDVVVEPTVTITAATRRARPAGGAGGGDLRRRRRRVRRRRLRVAGG